jgi:deoxyribonuclease-2
VTLASLLLQVNDDIFAHAKGALAFTDDGGFWMIHSAPKTPSKDYASLMDPSPYGQHFFCVALSAATIGDAVFRHLRMNNVFVDQSLPTKILQKHRDRFKDIDGLLEQTAKHTRPPVLPPYDDAYLAQSLRTRGGITLQAVAKRGCDTAMGKNWSCSNYEGVPNLYKDVMPAVLPGNMYIQTWCGGPWPSPSQACLPSYCPPHNHKVYNVRKMRLSSRIYWGTEIDHSKWLVSSATSPSPWTCFGDINYADVQRKRGGGMLCLQDATLGAAMQSFVLTQDPCG